MTALVLSLTDAGLAAVQAASGTDPVTIAEVGLTATPFTVAPTLTGLPGEFKRVGAISGIAAAPNVTHMTAYDTSADAWNATGLGLFLADGTLFAAYSSGSTVISKASPAFALISFDIAFDADLAASIAFGDPLFTNPPATEEMRGLIELATLAEAQAGADTQRALTPATAANALLNWLLARDGSGSGIDADMVDGQHLSRIAPAGMITAWYGALAAIPTGWALCDGTNGTPDLRDRFILGAGGTYAPGDAGGAAGHDHGGSTAGHTLTVGELPAHHHDQFVSGSVGDIGVVGSGQTVAAATNSSPGESEYIMRPLAGTPNAGISGDTGSGEAHGHGIGAASNLPPYHALAWIMKL